MEEKYINENEGKLKYEYNDNYFLPNPENFIFGVFPDNPDYQLLARVVTEDEFNQSAPVKTEFFHSGLSIISPPRRIIHTKNSKCEIVFGISSENPININHKLMISNESIVGTELKKDLDENILTKHIIKFRDKQRKRLVIQIRLPVRGTYQLILYWNSKIIISYILENNSSFSANVHQPFPQLNLTNLGSNTGTQKLNFNDFKPSVGVFDANDQGFAHVSFRADTDLYKIMTKLEGQKSNLSLQNQCITTFEHGKCNIRVFLHKRGEYALNVYYKVRSEISNSYKACFSYLINCRHDHNVKIVFPNAEQNVQLGLTERAEELGLTIEKSFKSFQEISQPIQFKFFQSKPLQFLTKLICIDFKGVTHDLYTYKFFENDEKQVRVRVNFPHQGMYIFALYGKEKKEKGSFPNLCIFNFLVLEKVADCFEFPEAYESCCFVEPVREIFKNEKVYFKVNIPEAKSVAVISKPDSKFFYLEKKGNLWEGETKVEINDTSLNIGCQVGESPTYTHYLIYKVEFFNCLVLI